MEIFGKSIRVTAILIVSLLLVILMIVSFVIYWQMDGSASKLGELFGSLAVGLLVAIIQLVIAWNDYAKNAELRKLELKEILYNRDSRDKYEAYITKSVGQIDVMGVTVSRFFDHFGDLDSNASEEAKTLVFALMRGVRVRILVPFPYKKYLKTEEKINKASNALKKYKKLAAKYDQIELRYFDHFPAHSIFRIDDTCIVGPVFPEVESKYTPALYLKNTSPMAVKYINYFDSEWDDATPVRYAKDKSFSEDTYIPNWDE